MADLKEFQIDGSVYNLKDETARNNIASLQATVNANLSITIPFPSMEIGMVGVSNSALNYYYLANKVRPVYGESLQLNVGDIFSSTDKSTYKFYVIYSTDGYNWIVDGWKDAAYTIPYDGYYIFVLGYVDNRAVSSVSDLASHYSVVRSIQRDTAIVENANNLYSLLDYVTPQMFGAKGDGITDDTAAFQALNGKNAFIPRGVYRISAVTYGAKTVICGSGMESTIIKQTANCDDDMITFLDAEGSVLTNLSLKGCGFDTGEMTHTYQFQALLKSRNATNALGSERCLFEHLYIADAPVNGFVLLGTGRDANYADGIYDSKYTDSKSNFVHRINDIRIMHCLGFCMIDTSSDNMFSNLYLSDGDKGCLLIVGVNSNFYTNIKIDQPYTLGASGSANGFVDGAGLLIREAHTVQLLNCDIQSCYYVGAKIYDTSRIYIVGDINSTGRTGVNGTGLIVSNSDKCNFVLDFHDVKTAQTINVDIKSTATNIVVYATETNEETSTNTNSSGTSVIITPSDIVRVFGS